MTAIADRAPRGADARCRDFSNRKIVARRWGTIRLATLPITDHRSLIIHSTMLCSVSEWRKNVDRCNEEAECPHRKSILIQPDKKSRQFPRAHPRETFSERTRSLPRDVYLATRRLLATWMSDEHWGTSDRGAGLQPSHLRVLLVLHYFATPAWYLDRARTHPRNCCAPTRSRSFLGYSVGERMVQQGLSHVNVDRSRDHAPVFAKTLIRKY